VYREGISGSDGGHGSQYDDPGEPGHGICKESKTRAPSGNQCEKEKAVSRAAEPPGDGIGVAAECEGRPAFRWRTASAQPVDVHIYRAGNFAFGRTYGCARSVPGRTCAPLDA